MKFYAITFENNHIPLKYYKNIDNAINYLWKFWYDDVGYRLSSNEKDAYMYFLRNCHSIPNYATIYEGEFADD